MKVIEATKGSENSKNQRIHFDKIDIIFIHGPNFHLFYFREVISVYVWHRLTVCRSFPVVLWGTLFQTGCTSCFVSSESVRLYIEGCRHVTVYPRGLFVPVSLLQQFEMSHILLLSACTGSV